MENPVKKSQKSGRAFTYSILYLARWISFILAVYYVGVALIELNFTKSDVDEDIGLIKSQIVPHFANPHNQSNAIKTLISNNLGIDQLVSMMLALVEQLFVYSALWLVVTLVLSLVIHKAFPDADELRRINNPPNRPSAWESIRSFYRNLRKAKS